MWFIRIIKYIFVLIWSVNKGVWQFVKFCCVLPMKIFLLFWSKSWFIISRYTGDKMGCFNSKKDINEDRGGKSTRSSRDKNPRGVSQPIQNHHVQQNHQLNQVTVDQQSSSANRKRPMKNAVTLQPKLQQESQNPSAKSQKESQQTTVNQNYSRQLNKDRNGETKDISDKDMAQIWCKNNTKTNKLASKPQQQTHKENNQNKNSNQYYNRSQPKKEDTPLISPDSSTTNNLKLDKSISASIRLNETASFPHQQYDKQIYLTSGLLATTKNTTCPRKDITHFTNTNEGKYQNNRRDLPMSKRLNTKFIINDKTNNDSTHKESKDANRNYNDIILSTNPLLQKQPQTNREDEQRRRFLFETFECKPSSEGNRSFTNNEGTFSLSPVKDVALASSPEIPIILATKSGSQIKNKNSTSPKLENNAQYTTGSIDDFERSNKQTVQSKHVTANLPTTCELVGKPQEKKYVDFHKNYNDSNNAKSNNDNSGIVLINKCQFNNPDGTPSAINNPPSFNYFQDYLKTPSSKLNQVHFLEPDEEKYLRMDGQVKPSLNTESTTLKRTAFVTSMLSTSTKETNTEFKSYLFNHNVFSGTPSTVNAFSGLPSAVDFVKDNIQHPQIAEYKEDFIQCHVEDATNFTTPENLILSNAEWPKLECKLEEVPDDKISKEAYNAVICSLQQIEQKALPFVTEIDNFTELEDSNKYYYIEESLRRLIDKLDDMFEDIGNVDALREKRKTVYKLIFPLFDKLDEKVQENKQRIENKKSQCIDRRQSVELNDPPSGFQEFQINQQEHEHKENVASGAPYNANPQVVRKSNEQSHKHYQDVQANPQRIENGQTQGHEIDISNIHHNELTQIIVEQKEQFDKLHEQQEQGNENRQRTKNEEPQKIKTELREEPIKTTYSKTELMQEKVVGKENGQAHTIENSAPQNITIYCDTTNETNKLYQKLSEIVVKNYEQNENAQRKHTRQTEGLRNSTEDKNGVHTSQGESNQTTVHYDKLNHNVQENKPTNYQEQAEKIEASLPENNYIFDSKLWHTTRELNQQHDKSSETVEKKWQPSKNEQVQSKENSKPKGLPDLSGNSSFCSQISQPENKINAKSYNTQYQTHIEYDKTDDKMQVNRANIYHKVAQDIETSL